MDIQLLERHREFLTANLEHLGHPFVVEHMADPELAAAELKTGGSTNMRVWGPAHDAVVQDRERNAAFLRELHDTWLAAGEPKGQDKVEFIEKVLNGTDTKRAPFFPATAKKPQDADGPR